MGKSPAERKQDQRNRDKAKAAAETARIARLSREEWCAANREKDKEKYDFAALQELHEVCLDQIHWLQTFANQNPDDPDFVSVSEGEQNLDDFVREHGVVRLGYIYRNQSLRPDCWTEYWKDKDVLAKLCAEDPNTKGYALYNLLAGIPDHLYISFKRDHGTKPPVDIGRYFESIGARQMLRYR